MALRNHLRADAAAGVINLKLYKDYRGVQLTLGMATRWIKTPPNITATCLWGWRRQNVNHWQHMGYHHNSLFNHDRATPLSRHF
jgi:hypothetical protein